jgi:hypothetical protein
VSRRHAHYGLADHSGQVPLTPDERGCYVATVEVC